MDHCVSLDDPEMNKAFAILERHNFKNIMTIKYPWNKEVITQFFAIVLYEDPVDGVHVIVHFSTQGQDYFVSYPGFAKILGFDLDVLDTRHGLIALLTMTLIYLLLTMGMPL